MVRTPAREKEVAGRDAKVEKEGEEESLASVPAKESGNGEGMAKEKGTVKRIGLFHWPSTHAEMKEKKKESRQKEEGRQPAKREWVADDDEEEGNWWRCDSRNDPKSVRLGRATSRRIRERICKEPRENTNNLGRVVCSVESFCAVRERGKEDGRGR